MKNKLYKLGKYLTVKFCPHENKELIFIEHQERTYQYKCCDCGEDVYIDMI